LKSRYTTLLRALCPALLFLAASPAAAEPQGDGAISWRTGALLTAAQSYFTLGVGLQLKTESLWTIEASADVALSDGSPLPIDTNGLLGAMPLALTGLYQPLPDWPVSPFVELGGGLNLLANTEPEPFLHGGGGAAYQSGDWGVATALRFLFLPSSGTETIVDDRGLQMTLSVQRGF
jgi:hypothetical protein